jgi:hypothetical protein
MSTDAEPHHVREHRVKTSHQALARHRGRHTLPTRNSSPDRPSRRSARPARATVGPCSGDEWPGVGVSPWALPVSSVRGAAQDRPGKGRLSALGPKEKVPVSARGDHMATSHQRTQHRADPSGASVISVNTSSPAVVWWSPTRSPMTIPPAAARRTWTPRPPTTATEPSRRSKPWAPATTSTCSGTWLPTRPRWRSGYEPEREATRGAPPEIPRHDAFGNPPRHFP